ncbi:hypothetical protein CSQ88_16345 [Iodobacter sp. BJB302]|nr:hypothetical protein CSQ88_16345 [Iodobacter sp. BJB302]
MAYLKARSLQRLSGKAARVNRADKNSNARSAVAERCPSVLLPERLRQMQRTGHASFGEAG